MKQNNIFKHTLKFSEKTSVSSERMYRMTIFVCLKLAPRIRGKIRLDSWKNRYYTNNTQGSHSIQIWVTQFYFFNPP